MRDRILDAAERLLGRLGYQKMTIDDIAAEAKIGRRTIYLSFSSKEELALATIDRIVERLLERLNRHAAAPVPWQERLRRMLVERVLFRFDSVREYYHSIDEIFRSRRETYMSRRAQYFASEVQTFSRVLAEASEDGLLRIDDLEGTAESLLFATNALLPSALSTRELGARSQVAARVSRIADLLIRGLEGSGASSARTRQRRRTGAARAEH
jgi:AcrR family transcriptional regulator